VLLFGLAYLTPIEVLGIYGVLTDASHGHTTLAYLVALLAMLLTALSYARLARQYTQTGAAYNYARRALHPTLGFLVGWATLLDYCFMPLVCWTIGATYLHETFPFVPVGVGVGLIVMTTTTINIMGITGAARLNVALMFAQFCIIAIFLGLCLNAVLGAYASDPSRHAIVLTAPLTGLTTPGDASASSALSVTMTGAAIAAYSFLGFDALGTLSEETIDPQKTMPRAIILTVACGGLIFVACAYLLQLASIGYSFANPLLATLDIAAKVGGKGFVYVVTAGLVVAEFAAGMVTQASVGRLIYAIGRDGMLPGPLFCRLHARFKTPVFNILLSAAFGLLALTLPLRTILAFISFGAFLAFTVVNLCVIRLYIAPRRPPCVHGPMHGVFCGAVSGLILPACGAIADIWLLMQLEASALLIGGAWLLLGTVYLCWRTRGFTRTLRTGA